jgi:hypothetical protein
MSKPCFYANASTWPSVNAALSSAGISRSHYFAWVAAWDGSPSIPGGFDAKQWQSNCCLDWDTFGSWMFKTPKPPPPPPPPPAPKPVYNYEWFPHSAPAAGLIGGPYSVPFNEHGAEAGDSNNERSIYRLYVTARAKPQTGGRIRYVAELKEEAHGLFNRLEAVIHSSSRASNLQFHRFGRAAVLQAIYEGKANVSWSAING